MRRKAHVRFGERHGETGASRCVPRSVPTRHLVIGANRYVSLRERGIGRW